MTATKFRFGEWWVDPSTNTLRNQHGEYHLEPRTMDVLLALCEQPGQILSAEDLLERCWGSTLHGDNPVHKTLAVLRRALGDDASQPTYIATIRKRGYHTVASVVREGDEQALQPWLEGSPFCGLAPFEPDRAAVFYGRQQALEQLQRLLRQRLQASTDEAAAVSQRLEMILVLGSSGAGKTSLIQAGLIPQLSQVGGACQLLAWSKLDLAEVGLVDCFTALGSCLLDWQDGSLQPFGHISAEQLGQQLHQQGADWCWPGTPAAADSATSDAPPRFLLFVDRLEALFHGANISAEQARALLQIFTRLATCGQVILILACRNDFYPQLGQFPLLRAALQAQAQFDLGPASAAEIAQMIRLPAAAAQLYFDSDATGARLDDILCQDASHSPDALPLLQYTLHELYRSRAQDGALCSAHYRQLGGIEGAIRQRAEALMAQLSAAQRDALPRVLALLATVSPSDGAITSHRAAWSALPDNAARDLVQALVEARLFVSDLNAGIPGFSIAHEALLRSWPRALEWIETHRDALRSRARLDLHSQRWDENERRPDLLLPPGLPLEEGQRLLTQRQIHLKPATQALILASAARARLQSLRRQVALGMIVLLALLAGVFALQAGYSQNLAQQRQEQAEGLLSFMLGEFAESLRPLGRLDLLDSVSSRALEFFAQTELDVQDPRARWQRARALQVLGEVSLARGQSDTAQAAFSAAHSLLEALTAQPLPPAAAGSGEFNQRQVLQGLGINAFWLGKLRMDHGDWDNSEHYFRSYLQSSQELVDLEPERHEWWIELSYAHNNLGSLALKQGHYDEARQAFSHSIEIKARTLALEPENAVLSAELADSLSWLGALEESQAQFDAAQDLYQRELTIVEQLRQRQPDDTRWQNRQALAQIHRAELLFARGAWSASQDAFATAAAVLDALHQQEPENRTWQRTQAYVQLWQLRLPLHQLWGSGDSTIPTLSAEQLEHSLAQLDQLSTELLALDPQRLEWLRLAAAVAQYQARLALWRGELERAAVQLATAVRHLAQVLNQQSEDAKARQLRAEVELLQAAVYRAQGRPEAALKSCQQALLSLGEHSAESRDYHLLVPWIHAQRCLHPDTAASAAVAAAQQFLHEQGYSELGAWLDLPAPTRSFTGD